MVGLVFLSSSTQCIILSMEIKIQVLKNFNLEHSLIHLCSIIVGSTYRFGICLVKIMQNVSENIKCQIHKSNRCYR